ncbi:hypothetical protein B0H13DRAFT_2465193 [Mycena leptocephala]|nr:hypothetical protein B0H13DRAFT_2465193 [Mycena leptocephala]
MENNKQELSEEDVEMGRKIDAGGTHGMQDTDARAAQLFGKGRRVERGKAARSRMHYIDRRSRVVALFSAAPLPRRCTESGKIFVLFSEMHVERSPAHAYLGSRSGHSLSSLHPFSHFLSNLFLCRSQRNTLDREHRAGEIMVSQGKRTWCNVKICRWALEVDRSMGIWALLALWERLSLLSKLQSGAVLITWQRGQCDGHRQCRCREGRNKGETAWVWVQLNGVWHFFPNEVAWEETAGVLRRLQVVSGLQRRATGVDSC